MGKRDRKIKPPSLAAKLLGSFLREDLAEDVCGDLEEKFYITAKNKSPFRARLNYWYQVFNYLRPFAFRKRRQTSNHYGMYRNYVKTSWRNLVKNKSYVIINTFGLGVSLACCITVYLLLAFNFEFDDYYDDAAVADIYTFHTHLTESDGRQRIDITAPLMFGPLAAEETSGVKKYCRYVSGPGAFSYGDKAFNEYLAFADSTFFDMFRFKLVAGSFKSFKEKNSIFLSEAAAKKYFGDEDPVGKMLSGSFVNDTEIQLVVGGVFKTAPLNSSFFFEMLMRFDNYIDINKLKLDDWSEWRNPATFLQLTSDESASTVASHFNKYIGQRNKARPEIRVDQYRLAPFKEKIYQSDIRSTPVMTRIDYGPQLMFAGMGLLILLIACFNLTNTSIAITAKRLKEVGIRKVVGATRKQIISQFMLDTVLVITMSMVVGLILSRWIVPAFYTMWGLPYGLEDLGGVNLVIALIVLVFVASIIAGMYPALLGSRFHPTALLKGDARVKGTGLLSRVLVAAQFSLSVVVLVAGVIFTQNTSYQESIDFGYNKDMLVDVDLRGDREFRLMEAAIQTHPKILSVGVADGYLGGAYETPITVDTTKYSTQVLGVGKNFFPTVGLQFTEGAPFDREPSGDSVLELAIVNHAFLDKTGMKDPIGKSISIHGGQYLIVGVVKNHIDNLYRSNKPDPFVFYPAGFHQYIGLSVRTEAHDRAEVQKHLEKTWRELFPGKPFQSRFQDELLLGNVRQTNSNFEKIFLFITVLGALLSSAGIFALASLNISRRTKEIGIRKALGARIVDIYNLLNKEFAIVLIIAVTFGGVGGYFATDYVMSGFFAYHIPVQIMPVVCGALAVFLLGIITTSITILSAARTNPVNTLKAE